MKRVEDPFSLSKYTHFVFFSVVCLHSNHPHVVRGRGGGLARWVGGSDWVGGWVWPDGSGWVGGWVGLVRWVGGSGWVGGGRLYSKVWTDAHMNATGF